MAIKCYQNIRISSITGREPGEIPVNSGRKKWSRIADAESTERLAVDVGGDFPG
jgi:hypothetical protein